MQESMAYNTSQIEMDPFADTNAEGIRKYEDETAYVILNYATMVTEIIKLIICVCVIVTDILLIFILSRFKKLKSKTNTYIMHYAIFNILYFLLAPVFYVFFELIYSILSHTTVNVFCIVIQVESSSLILGFLFAFGLGTDWLIMNFRPQPGPRLAFFQNYSVHFFYALGLLQFTVQSGFCFTDFPTMRHTIAVITYVLILMFTLVLNYLKYRNKIRTSRKCYGLFIANIIIFSWIPMYLYHNLIQLARNEEIVELVLWYTEFIPEWIAYTNSIVIFFMLWSFNRRFKKAFLGAFGKCGAYYNEDQVNLDDSDNDDSTENYNTAISYDNVDYYI